MHEHMNIPVIYLFNYVLIMFLVLQEMVHTSAAKVRMNTEQHNMLGCWSVISISKGATIQYPGEGPEFLPRENCLFQPGSAAR